MPENHAPDDSVTTGDEARRRSLIDDVTELGREASDYVTSELAYQKARAIHAGHGIKGIVLLLTGAFVLVVFGMVGLVIAAILALSLFMPGWAAGLVVGGGLVLVAAGLVAFAMGRWKSLVAALGFEEKGA